MEGAVTKQMEKTICGVTASSEYKYV